MTDLRRLLCTAAAGLAALASAAPVEAQSTAIVNARIAQEAGPPVRGTIVFQDGRIVAAGADAAVPVGATTVDAGGRLVTPGLIHPYSQLGLVEVGSVSDTRETNMEGEVNASYQVRDGLNPASVRIPVARAEGVTTALTVPSGGLVAGQATAIDLAGAGVLDMEIKAPVAMAITLGEGSKEAGGGTRAGEFDRLRSLFRDAREYQRRQADYRRGAIQPLSAPAADLEALLPVLRGEVPILARVRRRSDIEATLRLAREFSLHLVIVGGNEAWQVAPALAAAKVPVVVDPYANIPRFDGLATRYENAALLNQAGVTVLIYETEEGGPRDLRYAAGQAIRYGLPRDAALRAVTSAVADAFGLEGYGRIVTGAVADLVIWDGDPFDFSGAPARIFIRGREISRENRQTELRERYRTLPPSY